MSHDKFDKIVDEANMFRKRLLKGEPFESFMGLGMT